MTPAGLGGCVIEMMERGLVDFVISTGANLYHDLHYALNFTLRRGSPFLDDRDLYKAGIIRIYDVLFPATVLLETDAVHPRFSQAVRHERPGVDRGIPLPPRPGPARTAPGLRRLLRRRARREARRADLHLVARRQLDRHERRVARADERQQADDRSEPRRQRGLRDHPGRQEERLRDSRRRIAEEFLPAGTADALGGVRHSQGRQRVLHSDHDGSGRLGRALGRDAVGSRELGQGESWRAARYRRRLRDSTIAFPLFCEYAVGSKYGKRKRKALYHQREDARRGPRRRQATKRGRKK